MYETHFHLKGRPFAAVPQAEYYFPAAGIEAARATLARCLERGEGVGMAVGPPGTGKTLLCQVLARQLGQAFRVALLAGGRLGTRRALFQATLHALDQPYRQMDEGELRLALSDFATASDDCPRGIVLLVDEAHTVSPRLLDELRMMTDLTRNGQPAVRLALIGGRALEDRLTDPRLESISQRVVARCYLESLNRTETEDYIHARIGACGDNGSRIFPADTCQTVYKLTDGVPRLVNQVCDHALMMAQAAGRRKLEPRCIEAAWADLQQLPAADKAPCEEAAASGGVIEFGSLDDSPVDVPVDSGPAAAADEPPRPELHISSLNDDLDLMTDEPELQGCRSRPSRVETDDAFRPAGTIKPQVNVVFDEPAQMLQQPFAQEEVIVDRYALAVAAAKAAPAKAGAPSRPAGEPKRPAAQQPLVAAAPGRSTEAHTLPLHPEEAAPPEEPDDSDMIVVEEGCEDTPAWPRRMVVPVAKHEFGRLFARLRSG